ncbi:flagellar motor protein MotB [Quadrisphaera sp. GCM10027208]|uniref:flagellar motor protein MotB n=1 Tax=Quadrisphaera sp. GCM10027208 TaxID=3273423 RepID=UPI00360CAEBA
MSARRRQGPAHEEEEHGNHERWMVTYADMVTLLMVLFIVLFSMSQVDQRKYEQLKAGFAEQFGTGPSLMDGGSGLLTTGASVGDAPLQPGVDEYSPENLQETVRQALAAPAVRPGDVEETDPGTADGADTSADGASVELASLEKVRQQIQQALDARGMGDAVSFRYDERGLVVTIVTDEVLFMPGEADLQSHGREVLDAIGPALAPLPNAVTVDGHTDNVPISTAPFPSNWELSTARATTVLRYLLDRHGLDPARASASGYADQRPLAPNDSPSNRQVNRRVEVVVLALAPLALGEP